MCEILFTEKCTASALRTELLKNLGIQHVVEELRCLAIVGKTITGPWMTSFYTKNTKNLDMFRAIQDSLLQLQVWHADPTPMLECQKDILNQAVGGTEAITSDLSLTTCTFIMKPILSAVISVFERQFRPFLEGEFINPSPEDLEKASNAISHNMAAERILGLTDNLLR